MAERKTVTYQQPTATQQTTYAGVAAAAGIVIAWAIEAFTGVTVPAPVAVAFGTLIGWAAGKWGT